MDYEVLAAGMNNTQSAPGPPAVLSAQSQPADGDIGVDAGVNPSIVFSEPVTNVPGNVTFTAADGTAVAFNVAGVGPNGAIATVGPADIVYSITLQPTMPLDFGVSYTVGLSNAIHDLDVNGSGQPAPNPLIPYTETITTFESEAVGASADQFGSPGVVVLGNDAWLMQSQPEGEQTWGVLRGYDVSNPASPQPVYGTPGGTPGQFDLLGMSVSMAGEEQSPATGGKLLAVAADGCCIFPTPDNVYLYDVDNAAQPLWDGVVSLDGGPAAGVIGRIAMQLAAPVARIHSLSLDRQRRTLLWSGRVIRRRFLVQNLHQELVLYPNQTLVQGPVPEFASARHKCSAISRNKRSPCRERLGDHSFNGQAGTLATFMEPSPSPRGRSRQGASAWACRCLPGALLRRWANSRALSRSRRS